MSDADSNKVWPAYPRDVPTEPKAEPWLRLRRHYKARLTDDELKRVSVLMTGHEPQP